MREREHKLNNVSKIIKGITFFAFGHSFGRPQSTTGTGISATSLFTYVDKIYRALFPANWNNLTVNGSSIEEAAARFMGAPNGRWPYTGLGGILTLMCGQNSIGARHGQPLQEASIKNSLRLFITFCATYFGTISSATTVSTTGTWTTVLAAGAGGGSYKTTSEQDATIDIPVGDFSDPTKVIKCKTLCVIMFGTADSNGSDYEISVDGVLKATGNSSNKGFGSSTAPTPFPVLIRGLSDDLHVVSIKKIGSSGSLSVDCAFCYTDFSPQLILFKETYNTPLGYARYANPPSNSDIDDYNRWIDEVVAEFPEREGTITVIDPIASGWDINTMISRDGQHPNDIGHSFLANLALKEIANLPLRQGIILGTGPVY